MSTELRARLKKSPLYRSRPLRTVWRALARRVHPAVAEVIFGVRKRLQPGLLPAVVNDVLQVAAERGWSFQRHHPDVVQRCDASKTIAEDSLDVIRNGNYRLRHFGIRATSRQVAEMYYSHLYSLVRYPVHETFTSEIPEAVVLSPTGTVLTPERQVLSQSMYVSPTSARLLVNKREISKSRRVVGEYVSLLSYRHYNYTHWIMDSLPRLALFEASSDKFSAIIPPNPTQYQVDPLKLLGST